MPPPPKQPHPDVLSLSRHMSALKLPFMLEHHQAYAQSAADKHWSHLDYLTELVNGEAAAHDDRRVQRYIQLARFPVLKTLDQFHWSWLTKINRLLLRGEGLGLVAAVPIHAGKRVKNGWISGL